MKKIQCRDCKSTNTEYATYVLVAYRPTVLNDTAESAADVHKIIWDECREDRLDGDNDQHFMCNDCLRIVTCDSPEAKEWIAVDV